jgi:hypothetical protein
VRLTSTTTPVFELKSTGVGKPNDSVIAVQYKGFDSAIWIRFRGCGSYALDSPIGQNGDCARPLSAQSAEVLWRSLFVQHRHFRAIKLTTLEAVSQKFVRTLTVRSIMKLQVVFFVATVLFSTQVLATPLPAVTNKPNVCQIFNCM